MLNAFLPSVLVGTVLGFFTGLGTGGGSLLILWLTLVLETDPTQARLINLLFFLPSAIIASAIRWFRGGIPFKKVWLPALAGCAAAAVSAILCKHLDTENLKRLFGILLIYIGFRELCYRARKPK